MPTRSKTAHADTLAESAVSGMQTHRTSLADLLAHDEATVPLWSPIEPNAAGVVGIERTSAYGLARRAEFPVPVIRVGRQLRVSVAALLDMLGVRAV